MSEAYEPEHTQVDRCEELKDLEEANRRHLAHVESQLAEARLPGDHAARP